MSTWIKICGIRSVEQAQAVADCRVDALGLNFYTGSPRSIDVVTAEKIIAAVHDRVEIVGVFVNETPQRIAEIAQLLELDRVQLHGDESPRQVAEVQHLLPDTYLVRAWRMGVDGLSGLGEYLMACEKLDVGFFACLIDAHTDGLYGGSGRTVAWDRLNEEYQHDHWPLLILAGGLRPENVAQAIATVQPFGVDTASGVECAPGDKDIALVQQFVHEIERA